MKKAFILPRATAAQLLNTVASLSTAVFEVFHPKKNKCIAVHSQTCPSSSVTITKWRTGSGNHSL